MVDLLESSRLRPGALLRNLDQVHPGVSRILASARAGQGLDEWAAWLRALLRGGRGVDGVAGRTGVTSVGPM
jgi:hypothetical protein